MQISVPAVFKSLDLSNICANWTVDYDDNTVRMSPKVAALIHLVNALNRLLGAHTNRVFGNYCQPFQNANNPTDLNTTAFEFDFHNNWRNATRHWVMAIQTPETTTDNTSTGPDPLYWLDNANRTAESGVKLPSKYLDSFDPPSQRSSFAIERTAASFTAEQIQIGKRKDTTAATDGFFVEDLFVCDEPLKSLRDELSHLAFDIGDVAAGEKVLNSIFRRINRIFNEMRKENLMYPLRWSAHRTSGGWANPASESNSSHKLIYIPAAQTTYGNVFDSSTTVRSANTPGFMNFLKYCGRGIGTTVGIHLRVHGVSSDASNLAKVKFIGPNDSVEIELPTTRGWASASANLTMSTDVDDDDITSSSNKIDIHIKHETTASSASAIYGFRGRLITI